jgi:hypothetical protein
MARNYSVNSNVNTVEPWTQNTIRSRKRFDFQVVRTSNPPKFEGSLYHDTRPNVLAVFDMCPVRISAEESPIFDWGFSLVFLSPSRQTPLPSISFPIHLLSYNLILHGSRYWQRCKQPPPQKKNIYYSGYNAVLYLNCKKKKKQGQKLGQPVPSNSTRAGHIFPSYMNGLLSSAISRNIYFPFLWKLIGYLITFKNILMIVISSSIQLSLSWKYEYKFIILK